MLLLLERKCFNFLCCACVNPGPNTGAVDVSQTARTNDATNATFENRALNNPFAQGNFRWFTEGRYSHGNRAGQECVSKWFKTGGDL